MTGSRINASQQMARTAPAPVDAPVSTSPQRGNGDASQRARTPSDSSTKTLLHRAMESGRSQSGIPLTRIDTDSSIELPPLNSLPEAGANDHEASSSAQTVHVRSAPAATSVAASGMRPVTAIPTPPDRAGAGGCCAPMVDWSQVLRAGIVQAGATATTFGTKPFVEMAVQQACEAHHLDPETTRYVTAVAGGLYVSLIHTAASKIVSAYLNSLLQVNGLAPRHLPDSHMNEARTVSGPVTGAFIGAYAGRGWFMQGNSDPLSIATSKAIASAIGGLVQGAITNALRQHMPETYKPVPPAQLGRLPEAEFFAGTVSKALRELVGKDYRTSGHDLVGKAIGSVAGMVAATTLGVEDPALQGAGSGAAGMAIYLTGWFGGIHGGAELGSWLDAGAPHPPGMTTGVPDGNQPDIENPTDSDRSSGSSSPPGAHVIDIPPETL